MNTDDFNVSWHLFLFWFSIQYNEILMKIKNCTANVRIVINYRVLH